MVALACDVSEQAKWDAYERIPRPPVRDDKRVMNHMDAETKLVHIRLEAWGRWNRGGMPREWPEVSMMGRIAEYGPNGASQQSAPPVSMSDDMARLDAAVTRLGDIDKRAIRSYYFHDDAVETLARRMKMRPRQFQNVLRRARWRLAAFLSALEC